ncbi:hypothetical protein ASD04_17110 [Devosia sp. Root436]|uniref:DUF488 domain-containing protein n=1 Tax=Devosia sp. Root436 TaxID=1736537 RepID=UPI0006F1D2C4|nr:DUF488 domain-containing protein [Devosia sp. Root436]KQX34356.1 hypothetical protein ASD04_17110 [Devosia sp. Root436]
MAEPSVHFSIKRIYEPRAPGDGTRVLIDRLWPRGMTKAEARIDQWLKAVAPSPALRKWFGHDPANWAEFVQRYRAELAANAEVVDQLRAMDGKVTLLYAAHDQQHNHALVLLDFLQSPRKA